MIRICLSASARRRRGISFIEVAVSSLLVGILLTASLRGLAAVTSTGLKNQYRAMGTLLAHDLLSEMTNLPYVDPDEPPEFGLERSELAVAPRRWDDVDDFHGWIEVLREDRFGRSLVAGSGWKRSVVVDYVDPTDLRSQIARDLGVKRITVSVRREKPSVDVVAVGYQTAAAGEWMSRIEQPSREPQANQAPVARIQLDKSWAPGSATIAFRGEASFDPDGDTLHYRWDFADGAESSLANPTHTFTNTKGYDQAFQVTLTVTDSRGAADHASQVIFVLAD